jgi:Zn-dependent membrane protease YugP/Flp pilus assembly protein TadD
MLSVFRNKAARGHAMPDPIEPLTDPFNVANVAVLASLMLIWPALLFTLWVNRRFQQAFAYLLQVPSSCGLTGREVVRRLLKHAEIDRVRVVVDCGAAMRNQYHPLKRTITLANAISTSTSLAALAVAAHEVGHAVQHARGYRLAWLRTGLVPVTNICFVLGLIATVLGLMDRASGVMWAGVGLFAVCVLFSLVTVVLEFDASARARALAIDADILQADELAGFDRVLRAASFTYVAKAVQSGCGVVGLCMLLGTWQHGAAMGLDADEMSFWITGLLQVGAVIFLIAHRKSAPARRPALQAVELNNAGTALAAQGDLDEALADLDESVRLAPAASEPRLQRAHVQARRKEYDAALCDLDAVLFLVPESWPTVCIQQGDVWLEREEYDRAIEAYTEALSRGGQCALARCNRGLAYLRKGDLARALADCDEAVRIAPNEAVAYNNRGTVLTKLGNYARALADLQAAIHLSPKLPNGYKNLAWLQATCPDAAFRDGAEAIANAIRAIKLAGAVDGQWRDVLAAAHAEAGRFDLAVRYQEQALAQCNTLTRAEQQGRLDDYLAGRPCREHAIALAEAIAAGFG